MRQFVYKYTLICNVQMSQCARWSQACITKVSFCQQFYGGLAASGLVLKLFAFGESQTLLLCARIQPNKVLIAWLNLAAGANICKLLHQIGMKLKCCLVVKENSWNCKNKSLQNIVGFTVTLVD